MVNNRGTKPGGNHRNGGTDQTQDRMPLRQENEANRGLSYMEVWIPLARWVPELAARRRLPQLPNATILTTKEESAGDGDFVRPI